MVNLEIFSFWTENTDNILAAQAIFTHAFIVVAVL